MALEGRIVALVVAAGRGVRSGCSLPKQFQPLVGRTVLGHALDRLRHPRIDAIQVVIGPDQEAFYRQAVEGFTLRPPVTGGATRQQSVRNGLEAVAGLGFQGVLIHDAARPFVPSSMIGRLIEALDEHVAAVPVLPVADTLAYAAGSLGAVVDRSELVRVQTPQAFRLDSILAAHRAWNGGEATDDAQVARASGIDVAIVPGDPMAEKLTYADDFERAERHLTAGLVSRAGQGFDVHAFCPGDHLWLGGIRIPHDRGLEGHSDADVVLHAITDALLGAIGAGDIGDHFPPQDPKWRGAGSHRFVEHARDLIEQRGGRIDHVDVTVICENPRMGPHREAMRMRIAEMLKLPLAGISLKATTTEGLGFTGRGEGIAAQAIASVRLGEAS